MNIAVLGAGSLGSAIGGTLALAGNEVTLIGRAAHVEAINASGLTLVTPEGERQAKVQAFTSAEGLEPAELVIVLCKAFDTEECIETNRSIIGPGSVVLTLQNGLGNEDLLGKLLNPKQVIAGKTYIGGMMLAPGKVQSTTEGKQTFIGEYSGPVTPRIEAIAQIFNDAGMECTASPRMKNIIWDKLLINVATGAVCGISRLPYGELYQHPELYATAIAAVKEGMRVAIAEGIILSRHDPQEVLELARDRNTRERNARGWHQRNREVYRYHRSFALKQNALQSGSPKRISFSQLPNARPYFDSSIGIGVVSSSSR